MTCDGDFLMRLGAACVVCLILMGLAFDKKD